MGQLTISMAIFHSYVKLQGICFSPRFAQKPSGQINIFISYIRTCLLIQLLDALVASIVILPQANVGAKSTSSMNGAKITHVFWLLQLPMKIPFQTPNLLVRSRYELPQDPQHPR